MELATIISELRLELERIDQAIHSLERLSALHSKRRGRPPKWMAAIKIGRSRDIKTENRERALSFGPQPGPSATLSAAVKDLAQKAHV